MTQLTAIERASPCHFHTYIHKCTVSISFRPILSSHIFSCHIHAVFLFPILLIPHVARVIFAPFFLLTILKISFVWCQLRDILYFCVYKYNSCHLHIYEILFLIRFSCRFLDSLSYVSVSISRLSLLHSFFFRVNFALLFLFPVFYFVSGKATRFFSLRGGFLLL